MMAKLNFSANFYENKFFGSCGPKVTTMMPTTTARKTMMTTTTARKTMMTTTTTTRASPA